jgi:hypothetical protein
MTTAVSLIFGALMGTRYDAGRPYVEFRKTKLVSEGSPAWAERGQSSPVMEGARERQRAADCRMELLITAKPDTVIPDYR